MPAPQPKTRDRAQQIFALLARRYPDPRPALDFADAWGLLVATVLAAQCTDARVNLATPELFRRWPAIADLAAADVAALRAFLEASPLNYFHVFAFSPRPGTPAAAWPQVSEPDKKRRSAVLRELSARRKREFASRFAGRELDGVVIKLSGVEAVVLTGNYLEVRVPADGLRPGAAARVRIGETSLGRLRGVVVESNRS